MSQSFIIWRLEGLQCLYPHNLARDFTSNMVSPTCACLSVLTAWQLISPEWVIQEADHKVEVIVSFIYDLISKVTNCHFLFILFSGSNSLKSRPHTRGRDLGFTSWREDHQRICRYILNPSYILLRWSLRVVVVVVIPTILVRKINAILSKSYLVLPGLSLYFAWTRHVIAHADTWVFILSHSFSKMLIEFLSLWQTCWGK
jgi:hypothetical protein